MKNKFVIVLFLFFAFTLTAEQLKLVGNFISLSVSEEDGRFILYRRATKSDKWSPMIFEDYPSTSYFRFFDKDFNTIDFGLGGKNNYSETKIIDDSIVYFWQNKEIKIKLVYKLISSKAGFSSDTLTVDMLLLNLTDSQIKISYYFCLDTFLGEKSGSHFFLPGNVVVDKEREMTHKSIPELISSFDSVSKNSINVMFGKERQEPLTRIFFANWKKVEQSKGVYKVEKGANFDLKPYSINDSAIFLEKTNVDLRANGDASNRFIFNVVGDGNFEGKKVEVEDDKKDEEVKKESDDKEVTEESENELINMSLSDLLKLLDKINKKLSSGEKITEEDVELSKKILSEVKKRKGKK
ncbi:MAG TPA: hypothetical protein PLO89_06690 [Spirochaetota bacterium]|nr:hypothetical protein [Spirochaetota bacterium]